MVLLLLYNPNNIKKLTISITKDHSGVEIEIWVVVIVVVMVIVDVDRSTSVVVLVITSEVVSVVA